MTPAQRAIEALRKPDASLAGCPNTVRQSIADQIESLLVALEASQELLVTSLHYEGNEYRNDTGEQIKTNRKLLGPRHC